MLKIKEVFRLPAVLSIGIFLMLAQTAGAFFSRSLSLFSYAGLILAVSFSALPMLANADLKIKDSEAFKRSQFYSVTFNCAMLFIIAVYIFYKSFFLFSDPRGINPALTCWVALAAFAGFIPCALIVYPGIKYDKDLKALFYKYIFCIALAPVIMATSVVYYLKDMYFLDPLVSALISVLITVQAALLVKRSLQVLVS